MSRRLAIAMHEFEVLRTALSTSRLGRCLRHEPEVDSTNDWAARSLRSDPELPDGAVFVADRQSCGRGTGGNAWQSDDGGLWCSIALDEPLRSVPLPFLPAVSLVDALASFGIAARVKWPNDVLVDGRKIAGILIESERRFDGRSSWIVGVGCNVGQRSFPDDLSARATSIARLRSGESAPHRAEVLAELLSRMEEHERAGDLLAAWLDRTDMVGRRIGVRRNAGGRGVEVFYARVLGLTEHGHLRLVDEGGAERVLVSASDVDILMPAD